MNKTAMDYDKLGYYQILEATAHSSEEEIRQKYRELAKRWHPDHNPDPTAIDKFQKISAAFDILKDSKSRLKYMLLSFIYDKNNFPDMNALCLLRNMHGLEDLNLRAFPLTEVTGKGLLHKSIYKVYYCSQYEAAGVIGNITRHNWIYGFLGVTALFANCNALIKNILQINDKKANLNLLIHNALVYEAEGKKQEAMTLALLAEQYASKEVAVYLKQFINSLQDCNALSVKKWDFKKLVYLQLFYPFIVLLVVLLIGGVFYLKKVERANISKANVKEVVVFNNGEKAFSDVAVAKIFDIPVDVSDKQKLYHVIEKTEARHGADTGFDIYKTVEAGTTVRVTGYTVDQNWYRVMFDNGEMAFIEQKKLQQGIGDEIPLWSKIYKEE
ncbi:MAG: DnaJ domain-containing protein [Alphaproteobacteria bacterium]|nr:DnaJ domain-containing protein [Alphaproteobacteria bacterium]